MQLVKPKTKRSSPQRHRTNVFCHLVAGLKRGVCVGSGLRLSAVKLSIADHEQERFLLLKHAFTTTDTSTQTPARGTTVLKKSHLLHFMLHAAELDHETDMSVAAMHEKAYDLRVLRPASASEGAASSNATCTPAYSISEKGTGDPQWRKECAESRKSCHG